MYLYPDTTLLEWVLDLCSTVGLWVVGPQLTQTSGYLLSSAAGKQGGGICNSKDFFWGVFNKSASALIPLARYSYLINNEETLRVFWIQKASSRGLRLSRHWRMKVFLRTRQCKFNKWLRKNKFSEERTCLKYCIHDTHGLCAQFLFFDCSNL